MPSPTEEQLRNRQRDAGGVPTIDVSTLGQPVQQFTPAPLPDFSGQDLLDSLSASRSGLDSAFQQQQGVVDKQSGEITGDITALGNKQQFRNQQEDQRGVQQLREALGATDAEIAAITAERQAIPLQIQEESRGRGRTTGGVAPIETGRLRQNAIRALSANATRAAQAGRLDLALEDVDRAVEAEFAPIEARLQAKMFQFQENKELLNSIDEKRTAALERELALEAERVAEAKDDRRRAEQQRIETRSQISNLALTAREYGADDNTVRSMLDAETLDEAILRAGAALRDPRAIIELESARLDNRIKRAQLANINEPTQKEKEQAAKLSAEAQESFKKSTERIQQIKELIYKTDKDGNVLVDENGSPITKALKGVGPNIVARIDPLNFATGAKTDFLAEIDQLIEQDFLDNLINIKGQGATFGALTEREGEAIRQAANKLAKARREAIIGTHTAGIALSEKVVREELEKMIINAQEIQNKALGQIVTDSENEALDAMLDTTLLNSADAGSYY